jgi:thymidine phosphorylase
LSFLPQVIIQAKRDGRTLAADDIRQFITGVTTGAVSDAQIAAFAMAAYLQGLSPDETIALTLAMRDSGDVLAWDDIDRPIADKHSTGGVGDNVSLMLAPILAACGAAVPMISGRGLGHTGGTLDKLESIPGYQITLTETALRQTIRSVGCAIVGQSGSLAPADKRIYAVRDVTATVESIPLITASILSKKLAAGLQSLVLDVKTGTGAFMTRVEDAEMLARSLVTVANGAGLSTTALITAMDEPLASAAGNAVEVQNAVDFLTGKRRDKRLEEVTLALAAEALLSAKLAVTPQQGFQQAMDALNSGAAADRFASMVHSLGGPSDLLEYPDRHLPAAPVVRPVPSPESGTLAAIDTREIGLAVVGLGGGRRVAEDAIDHAVGISGIARTGSTLHCGDPIAFVHARDEAGADRAVDTIMRACIISDQAPEEKPAILSRVTRSD